MKIKFISKYSNLINLIEKPFVNVQTVTVHYCKLGDQFSIFPQWFPNVRILKLIKIGEGSHWLDLPFHHLEHVQIIVNDGNEKYDFTKVEAARLLCASKQLKILEIYMPRGGMTLKTLLNIIKEKPAMKKLTLEMASYCPAAKPMEIQRLIDEHPLLVELSLKDFTFTVENALKLIRQLHSLEKFYFCLNNSSEYTRFASHLDDSRWEISSTALSNLISVNANKKEQC